ncbi:MAG: M20/M25/M40 family metallo-hydrolase [Bacteroidetes bacterium]|nr:M20/M25/M40 family metallo-hydrolase [Bacteroidota bacterium]
MHRILLTAWSLLFLNIAFAQNDSLFIRKLADEILVNSKAYENLHTLTKTVGPRLSGTPQTYKAEEWGKQALKNAGADKVYLQECKIPHWVRGGKDEGKLIVGGKETALSVLALGNSIGTGAKGITAPAILINSWDELEQRKKEVKGKIVFYNYKFNPRFIHVFRAYSDANSYRTKGASRAAQYGAVATVVRSMSESTNNYPHTGAMIYNDSFPKIPTLAVGLLDADKIATAIQQNKNVSLFVKTNAHALPDTVGYNVIGEFTGTEFPDQYITVGGHLDSWDPAEGAHDDGTGCVHSIEVLRALKAVGYHPRHTIRVVLFSDEENTGGGSKKYINEAKNEKHVFALESDAGGFTPRGFSLGTTKERMDKMTQWIPLLQPYGVYEFTGDGGGADVDSLNIKFGIPVGELIPDSQRYFDLHHAANDVFENVNKRELELGAVNMAALIYLVDKYGL